MRTVLLAGWLGAIVFFAIGVPPQVFVVLTGLPEGRELAGDLVSRSLTVLHYMGMIAGAGYVARGYRHLNTLQNWMVIAMLALTMVSQFVIIARMNAIRSSMHLQQLAPDDPRPGQFDLLHTLSTVTEGAIFVIGCTALAMKLPARRAKREP